MDKHDDETVERVARALYPLFAGIVTGRFPPSSYDDTLEENREAARELARAALSALPARDEGLEGLRELSERATKGEWRPGRSDMMSSCGGCDMTFKNIYVDDPRGGMHKPTNSPLGLTVAKAVSEMIGAENEIAIPDEEVFANAALIAAAVNYVRNKLAAPAQEPSK